MECSNTPGTLVHSIISGTPSLVPGVIRLLGKPPQRSLYRRGLKLFLATTAVAPVTNAITAQEYSSREDMGPELKNVVKNLDHSLYSTKS